ncbi:uncharacterized protein LOC110604489 [Manihot esculenta]|uniref:DUF1645 domain-containing protein n=1 Tax=Manihot esculenta TaxID=3983 RepID=A0A2C9U6G8_MANES|nr:uncharacterized protein LOC110604489 [Manihot esculenta]OAY25425.1 hypothetical protein MANES_17G093500v8 [Manihot esculenta]
MEMEVVVPVPPVDFNFDSTCSSPYMTAPSSPQRFGNLFSAPTSPSRVSTFYRELNDASLATNSSSSVPFDWEEKPGTPKSRNGSRGGNYSSKNDHSLEDFDDDDGDDDFEFSFSGQLDRTSLSADELFDGGKIRPLKPPPGYDSSVSTVSSPRSPRSRTSQKKDFDPFQAAMEETRRKESKQQQHREKQKQQQRGRERSISSSSSAKSSNYKHKGSRSLSPLRVSDDLMLDQEENSQDEKVSAPTSSNPKSSFTTSYASSFLSALSFSSKGYKKWKLKDFLLFRSASEGRATGKDPLTKYSVLSKRDIAEDVKNCSFRSTDSSVGGSSRRRAPVSAHELHYTVNRAVSEEMKRKTFLPYKHGLLGCLGFNPGLHEITRGVGSLTRG